ncbi:hypothetical protein [Pseudalkalibacillus sp. SCS-8]|uniref:hypothetical protein n=1 Tax=Pseudalkalibacillus nanhaiensis TaxID=3115291 RepID=UPI0032DB3562
MKLLISITVFIIFGLSILFGIHLYTEPVSIQLVETDKTLPERYQKDRLTDYLLTMVHTEEGFEEKWEEFQLSGTAPTIDFNRYDSFFLGFNESGGCAIKPEHLEFKKKEKSLIVRISTPYEYCQDMAVPRTFVYKLEKELAKELTEMVIVNEREEKKVPID